MAHFWLDHTLQSTCKQGYSKPTSHRMQIVLYSGVHSSFAFVVQQILRCKFHKQKLQWVFGMFHERYV